MSSITLTPDQCKAKEAILDFLNSDQKYFILSGFAGTGKTTIIRDVMETYFKVNEFWKLVNPDHQEMEWELTATTNKAAEALENAAQLPTKTIHNLLGLIIMNDYDTGESRLVRKRNAFHFTHRIIVIDECSYIDWDLLNYITKHTNKCKVIFMGDASQLTPVKRTDVPVFNQGYPTFHLTQSVRQEASSPIHAICADLRDTILNNASFPKITLSPQITRLSKPDFDAAIIKEFTRPDWQQSDSKILAWRNRTVQLYNLNIFEHIHKRSNFKPGDYVINNHYVNGLKTDAELVVQECTPAVCYGIAGHQMVFQGKSVFVPDDIKDYTRAKKKFIDLGDSDAVQEIMDFWADIRPAYACTVNKSQGSTYDRVFIDLNDLGTCKMPNQLARLLYVAISRAKSEVIFTGDL